MNYKMRFRYFLYSSCIYATLSRESSNQGQHAGINLMENTTTVYASLECCTQSLCTQLDSVPKFGGIRRCSFVYLWLERFMPIQSLVIFDLLILHLFLCVSFLFCMLVEVYWETYRFLILLLISTNMLCMCLWIFFFCSRRICEDPRFLQQ